MKKRNLFAEIAEGFDALAEARAGKRTLRTHEVEMMPVPEVSAEELLKRRVSERAEVIANRYIKDR